MTSIPSNLADFIRHMVETECWDVPEIVAFLSRPYRWEREWEEWRERGNEQR